jgi:hypothetical protein
MQQSMTLQQAVDLLQGKRPDACVCPALFAQLQALEVAIHGGETTVKTSPYPEPK